MGEYEDLVANTVESVLAPGQPMTLTQIAEALTERDLSSGLAVVGRGARHR